MSVTSTRRIVNRFEDDIELLEVGEATNTDSPAQVQFIDLASGANTITPPTGAIGFTLILPSGNVETVTLKGITGDTGVVLHPTDPTSVGLNSTSTFVLTASDDIDGCRIIWS